LDLSHLQELILDVRDLAEQRVRRVQHPVGCDVPPARHQLRAGVVKDDFVSHGSVRLRLVLGPGENTLHEPPIRRVVTRPPGFEQRPENGIVADLVLGHDDPRSRD
jgi:hypothetical protein